MRIETIELIVEYLLKSADIVFEKNRIHDYTKQMLQFYKVFEKQDHLYFYSF